MRSENISIDVSNADIKDFSLERDGEEAEEVAFSIKGIIHEIDEQKIEDTMLSSKVNPVSVTLEIERPESN